MLYAYIVPIKRLTCVHCEQEITIRVLDYWVFGVWSSHAKLLPLYDHTFCSSFNEKCVEREHRLVSEATQISDIYIMLVFKENRSYKS